MCSFAYSVCSCSLMLTHLHIYIHLNQHVCLHVKKGFYVFSVSSVIRLWKQWGDETHIYGNKQQKADCWGRNPECSRSSGPWQGVLVGADVRRHSHASGHMALYHSPCQHKEAGLQSWCEKGGMVRLPFHGPGRQPMDLEPEELKLGLRQWIWPGHSFTSTLVIVSISVV